MASVSGTSSRIRWVSSRIRSCNVRPCHCVYGGFVSETRWFVELFGVTGSVPSLIGDPRIPRIIGTWGREVGGYNRGLTSQWITLTSSSPRRRSTVTETSDPWRRTTRSISASP